MLENYPYLSMIVLSPGALHILQSRLEVEGIESILCSSVEN